MLDKKKNLVDETYISSILDRIIYRHVLIEIEKERTVEGKGGKGRRGRNCSVFFKFKPSQVRIRSIFKCIESVERRKRLMDRVGACDRAPFFFSLLPFILFFVPCCWPICLNFKSESKSNVIRKAILTNGTGLLTGLSPRYWSAFSKGKKEKKKKLFPRKKYKLWE